MAHIYTFRSCNVSIKLGLKRNSLDSKKYDILDYNAKPVTAIEYTGYSLQELHLEYDQSLLREPPYSPDIALNDYDIFFDFCKWLSYVKLSSIKTRLKSSSKTSFFHYHLPNLIQKISNSCRVSGNKALQIMADISLNKI